MAFLFVIKYAQMAVLIFDSQDWNSRRWVEGHGENSVISDDIEARYRL